MSFFRSKHLIAAKALSTRNAPTTVGAHHTPTAKELVIARRMAHEGRTLIEVHDALGWGCSLKTTLNRLRKFNIHPINPANRAHRGFQTGLSKSHEAVGMQVYRPKSVEPSA